ncbi:methyltransferase, FkbM family [Cribrihabitans marinus]|uniref:Methyltransferase, FkbM family n=1 Tax=Cribrihabitans marinus TaxID=1227549 RepID=A0A1H6RCK3_9RHOB|nr:FkbM family methyltransferase [Cribrihabitans marinus]GGH20384.1 FkbM family methyltransferase [Cribrihabitans marinus]SEI50267.1 methyltransferase, FkbM family [Cribrihabitans marinus]
MTAADPGAADDAPDTPETIACRDIRFPLDRGLLTPRLRTLLRSDGFEAKEADAALRLVKRGDVVMELGGGLGFLSTLLALKTRAKAVHSYEPNLALVRYAREVHALNRADKAQMHHGVLGDAPGEATFYLRDDPLTSSLFADHGPGEVLPLRTPVLSAEAEIARLSPTILICDIEGAEADLLPKLDLSGLRGVLVELHPRWIGAAGVAGIFARMHAAGLVFFPRLSQGKVAVFKRGW